MAARVGALKGVGGWDEQFISNHEDVDISRRMKESGCNLLYAPDCKAWHLKRDTEDSVLRTFWNWNYFGYERWRKDIAQWPLRLAAIWDTYRRFRVEDLQHPSLRMLTLKLPWSWMIRDLAAVRGSSPEVGNISEIVRIAHGVLTRYAMPAEARAGLIAWLKNLAAGLVPAEEKHPQFPADTGRRIFYMALASICDANYWRDFPK